MLTKPTRKQIMKSTSVVPSILSRKYSDFSQTIVGHHFLSSWAWVFLSRSQNLFLAFSITTLCLMQQPFLQMCGNFSLTFWYYPRSLLTISFFWPTAILPALIFRQFLTIFSSSLSPSFWTLMFSSFRQISHRLIFLISLMISSQSLNRSSQDFFSLQQLYSLHYYLDYLEVCMSTSASYRFFNLSLRPSPKSRSISLIYASAVMLIPLIFFSVAFLFHLRYLRPKIQTAQMQMTGILEYMMRLMLMSLVIRQLARWTATKTTVTIMITLLLFCRLFSILSSLSSLALSFFRVFSASLIISSRCVNLFSCDMRPSTKNRHIVKTIASSLNNQWWQICRHTYLI